MAKDEKGHGSEARGVLEGGAAHQSAVRKMLAAGDVHSALSHAVTRYDREQSARASAKGTYYNPNAIGLYLGRAADTAKAIKGGALHADAINANFNGSLANRLHKALGTGGKDVDTLRRAKFK